MKFSFVLPAYKATYLDEAIKSILRQSYTNFELIIVDDFSPEDLRTIVDSNSDKRIHYFRNKFNIGGKDLVSQWNHSLEYATGDYVILATDDDLYEKNFLEIFEGLIDKYPKVDIFRARVLSVNSQNNIIGADLCYKECISQIEFIYNSLRCLKGGIPQYVFKRESLIRNGGFVEFPMGWGSDDATAILLSKNGIVNAQEYLVRFRISKISITGNPSYAFKKFQARLIYAEWLRSFVEKIKCENNDLERFYSHKIHDSISIYNKQTIISTMDGLNFIQWFRGLAGIFRSMTFSKKDKVSILFHTAMNRSRL